MHWWSGKLILCILDSHNKDKFERNEMKRNGTKLKPVSRLQRTNKCGRGSKKTQTRMTNITNKTLTHNSPFPLCVRLASRYDKSEHFFFFSTKLTWSKVFYPLFLSAFLPLRFVAHSFLFHLHCCCYCYRRLHAANCYVYIWHLFDVLSIEIHICSRVCVLLGFIKIYTSIHIGAEIHAQAKA